MNIKTLFSIIVFSILFLGCSTKHVMLSTTLKKTTTNSTQYRLQQEVRIKALHSSESILKSETHWDHVGSIEYGEVYRTEDQIVIVNSFNVFEAYIVVKNNNVVGYFVPSENSFIEIKAQPINLVKIEE